MKVGVVNFRKNFLVSLFTAMMVLAIAGCGGDSGDDDEVDRRSFEGIVTSSSSGGPLAQVELHLVRTGEMTMTSEDGVFQLDTGDVSDDYAIDVAGYSFASRITLLNISRRAERITLRIRMDLRRQRITVSEATAVLTDGQLVSIEYEDD